MGSRSEHTLLRGEAGIGSVGDLELGQVRIERPGATLRLCGCPSVERGDGGTGVWVSHDHKVPGFSSKPNRGLQSNGEALLKQCRFNRSCQIKALAHRPGVGKRMVYTRQIKTGNIHLLPPCILHASW